MVSSVAGRPLRDQQLNRHIHLATFGAAGKPKSNEWPDRGDGRQACDDHWRGACVPGGLSGNMAVARPHGAVRRSVTA